ncbi:MAG: CinA family nicotinamide mononucleotide deamidase-related protein [Planctomycetia bacterium]|nr:CinA family nicotinamide mononucleotide deamidase-related protein [Planctomycetia bacterium]
MNDLNKQFCAEIISVGDEITSGSILDTNSQWLSMELASLGIRTLYHSTVGDELKPMVDVLTQATQRSNLIIVTGGLGPTEDDLTRQAVAQMLNVPLVSDPEILKHIETLFKNRNRVMPDSNKIQASFPQGAFPIPNPNGTAPGFDIQGENLKSGRFRILTFPGVPSEMKEMWAQTSKKAIETMIEQSNIERHFIKTKLIHCFGAGESDIESRLPHLINRNHIPKVGITASRGVITLRIQAESCDENNCFQQISETVQIIRDKVGELIFGEDSQTLASVVCEQMRKLGKKVGVLEWGTQGYLAQKIEPDCFAGGSLFAVKEMFTPYSIKALAAKLFQGTPADYILAVGPYPEPMTDSSETDQKNSISAKNKTQLTNSDSRIDQPGLSQSTNCGQASVCFLNCETDQFMENHFVFWEHPSIRDEVYSNRALNLLRNAIIAPNVC